MHETSIAESVLGLVEQAARQSGFARVTRLTLDIGCLAGIEVESLRFALDALAPGTLLEGAQWQLCEHAAQAWCMQCAAPVPIHTRLDDCPQCGGHQLQPVSGTELRVRELLVADAPAPPAAHTH
ncbi:hydrogenase maturation nickel metallochaperone HypA [Frateuria defendens]|uniref:hydrogenase maturation nickel metallochaperone HypA n=1 Tax=Frateuria defendens TaxID=2219559 RepID=UPI00066FFD8B|nr:hydrogenase maturation nickel metallochaperone HypA [Frateuria defendens]